MYQFIPEKDIRLCKLLKVVSLGNEIKFDAFLPIVIFDVDVGK